MKIRREPLPSPPSPVGVCPLPLSASFVCSLGSRSSIYVHIHGTIYAASRPAESAGNDSHFAVRTDITSGVILSACYRRLRSDCFRLTYIIYCLPPRIPFPVSCCASLYGSAACCYGMLAGMDGSGKSILSGGPKETYYTNPLTPAPPTAWELGTCNHPHPPSYWTLLEVSV